MRWEVNQYFNERSPARRSMHDGANTLFGNLGRILGGAVKEGSPMWHRFSHLLSLMPSLAGSLRLRQGFMEASIAGFGVGCTIFPGCFITYPRNVTIGDRVFLNRNVFINALAPVTIGDDTLIGPNVVINSANHVFETRSMPMREQRHELGAISIGTDVWLAANSVITAGVSIGEGAVIAAGSVVTRNIEPYSVVGGVPARLIKMRP